MKQSYNFEDGEVLLIDKPYKWSSFDVVKKIRNRIGIKKVGHAGTLDPLATGLLILCTGKKTKEINQYQQQEKEYIAKMVLGKATPSIDLETEIAEVSDIRHLSQHQLESTVKNFLGRIKQIPPAFSAIKMGGTRVYKKARKGENVKMFPREVEILEIEISKIQFPEVELRITCSSGTYVRSLVRDIGESLEVGAYLAALRRTRIGKWHVDQAYSMDHFLTLID